MTSGTLENLAQLKLRKKKFDKKKRLFVKSVLNTYENSAVDSLSLSTREGSITTATGTITM